MWILREKPTKTGSKTQRKHHSKSRKFPQTPLDKSIKSSNEPENLVISSRHYQHLTINHVIDCRVSQSVCRSIKLKLQWITSKNPIVSRIRSPSSSYKTYEISSSEHLESTGLGWLLVLIEWRYLFNLLECHQIFCFWSIHRKFV